MFPDLLDPASYFKTYAIKLASSRDGSEGVSYNAAYAAHKRLHERLGIFVTKVLHQGRGQCQRDLDGDDVQLQDIQRMAHYLKTEQFESYLLNLPVHALASAGGWDHENFHDEECAHLDADPENEVVDAVGKKFAPFVYDEVCA